MSRWMNLTACVLAWMATPASSNEAVLPRLQPHSATDAVVVIVDDKAEAVRVQVPNNLLSQLLATAPKEGQGGWAGVPRFHLMAAGIFLSLALGCGGFWLMRRSKKFAARGLLMLLAAIVLLSLSAAVAWANGTP